MQIQRGCFEPLNNLLFRNQNSPAGSSFGWACALQ